MKFELSSFHRDVPSEELLADLRAVADKLKAQSLTQAKYDVHGRFCAATFKKRFGTWNAALSAASLAPTKLMNVDPKLIIEDIQRVAGVLQTTRLTRDQYEKHGKYSGRLILKHFKRWKVAAAAARVEPAWNYEVTNDELFDNLERVWRHLGRQPTVNDMVRPLSRYSKGTYAGRFGSYRKALEAFVAAVDSHTAEVAPDIGERNAPTKPVHQVAVKARSRTVGWRLRFLTFRRDGFRCTACGRSPATSPGVVLHVDHKEPWSNGGTSELENLQTLCSVCNGGKSNLDWEP